MHGTVELYGLDSKYSPYQGDGVTISDFNEDSCNYNKLFITFAMYFCDNGMCHIAGKLDFHQDT